MPVVIKGRIKKNVLFYTALTLILTSLMLLTIVTLELYFRKEEIADELGVYAYICLSLGVVINLIDLYMCKDRQRPANIMVIVLALTAFFLINLDLKSTKQREVYLWVYYPDMLTNEDLKEIKEMHFDGILFLMRHVHRDPSDNWTVETVKRAVEKIRKSGLKIIQLWNYQRNATTLDRALDFWIMIKNKWWKSITWDGIYLDDLHIRYKWYPNSVKYHIYAVEQIFNNTKRIYEAYVQSPYAKDILSMIEEMGLDIEWDWYHTLTYKPPIHMYPTNAQSKGAYVWLFSANELTLEEIKSYIDEIYGMQGISRIIVFSWEPANEKHPVCIRDYPEIKEYIKLKNETFKKPNLIKCFIVYSTIFLAIANISSAILTMLRMKNKHRNKL